MPMEMPLIMQPSALSQAQGRYDVVTLDRDKDDVRLRFLNRGQVGRKGSRDIRIDAATAEALLVMLSRELDTNDQY